MEDDGKEVRALEPLFNMAVAGALFASVLENNTWRCQYVKEGRYLGLESVSYRFGHNRDPGCSSQLRVFPTDRPIMASLCLVFCCSDR